MSNYIQSIFFSPKDSLSTGDPLKKILGSDFDTELGAISTAIGTKVDTAGDGLSKNNTELDLYFNDLSAATIASADELVFGDVSDSNKVKKVTLSSFATSLAPVIGPTLAGSVTTTGLTNTSGVLRVNINSLTTQTGLAPASDYLMMYDSSAAALRKVAIGDLLGSAGSVLTTRTLTAGTGLTGGGDLSANRTFALDTSSAYNTNHNNVSIVAGTGLFGGGTIAASRTLSVNFSSLGLYVPTDVNAGQDGFVVSDNGVPRVMKWNDVGVDVVTSTASQTFVDGDIGTLQLLTGGTGRTFIVPANLGHDGSIILVGSRDTAVLTIAGSGATVTSANGLLAVAPGGMAALIRVSATEWMLSGDLQ